jgi:flagellar hook-length control protein FliK
VKLDTDSSPQQEASELTLVMPQANENAASQTTWGASSLNPSLTMRTDPNGDARKQADMLPQGSGSAVMSLQTTESPALAAASDTPEVAGKADVAAIAAAGGQALPSGKAAKSAETGRMGAATGIDAKGEVAGRAGEMPSASGLRGEAASDSPSISVASSTVNANAASQAATSGANIGATPAITATNNPINLVLPFDQALRQAEAKINVAIEAPVRSPAFAAELGDKVVWLATRQGQYADLSLNPPQMGALEVRLNLSGSGDASAQFFSANPAVREAIDAALPKLRELMAQAGITLGDAEVREHAFDRREQADLRRQSSAKEGDIPVSQAVMAGVGGGRTAGTGLVDLYI